MPYETDFDRNWALSDDYEQGPRWFIPGYDASHAMAAMLLRDRIGDRGRILVIGAGGGVELAGVRAGKPKLDLYRGRSIGRDAAPGEGQA